MNDHLEIYCDACKAANELPFEGSFQNTSIKCVNCGSRIYWYHCIDCETGYYSNQENKPCPECLPKQRITYPDQSEPVLRYWRKFFCVKCPECGRYHFGFSVIGSYSICACGIVLDAKGVWKTIIVFFTTMLLLAALADEPIHNFLASMDEYIAFAFGFTCLMIYASFLIPRFVRLEKYPDNNKTRSNQKKSGKVTADPQDKVGKEKKRVVKNGHSKSYSPAKRLMSRFPDIAYFVVFIASIVAYIYFSDWLLYLIQETLFSTADTMYVAYQPIGKIVFFAALFFLCSEVYVIGDAIKSRFSGKKRSSKQKINKGRLIVGVAVYSIVVLYLTIASVMHYSVFSNEGIEYSNGFIIFKNKYLYSEVVHVKLSYMRRRSDFTTSGISYTIQMKDGTEIELIGWHIYPDAILNITSAIPRSVTYDISEEGFRRLMKRMPNEKYVRAFSFFFKRITLEEALSKKKMRETPDDGKSGSNTIPEFDYGKKGLKDSTAQETSSQNNGKLEYGETFQLIDEETGKSLADYPYKIRTESGKIFEGRTDANGYTQRISTDGPEAIYLVEEKE